MIVAVLKAERYFTGSQCKDLSTGVMWENLDVLVAIRASEF